MVLICISLMANHMFMCTFFGETAVYVLCHFSHWIAFFFLLSFESYLYILDTSSLLGYVVYKYFLLISLSPSQVLQNKVFNFNEVQFISFAFHGS